MFRFGFGRACFWLVMGFSGDAENHLGIFERTRVTTSEKARDLVRKSKLLSHRDDAISGPPLRCRNYDQHVSEIPRRNFGCIRRPWGASR